MPGPGPGPEPGSRRTSPMAAAAAAVAPLGIVGSSNRATAVDAEAARWESPFRCWKWPHMSAKVGERSLHQPYAGYPFQGPHAQEVGGVGGRSDV